MEVILKNHNGKFELKTLPPGIRNCQGANICDFENMNI